MARYLDAVKRKAYWFDFVSFTLVPKEKNDQVDALTNLGSSSPSGFAAGNHPLAHECHFAALHPHFAVAKWAMKWVAKTPLLCEIGPLATNHVAKSSPSYESSCKSSSSCGITSKL
ncbi:hypothetical protein CK203_040379 [Vitis vinifera]|uniref:Uncharacterized protein n=1 Tax=Vitis vinifera TaxID=29760 RepID=A0A438FX85_VITVI|nr:hypothetical protein CK203_040379 [Vitis vinifera]